MILRRLSLFLALLVAVAATQVPEFVQQYQQRLGGAIDELTAIVKTFDAGVSKEGLTEAGGIDRLLASADPIARQQGEEKRDIVERLHMLHDAQDAFRNAGPVARLATFVTHYDGRVAAGAMRDYQPAVPTSAEAFVLGLIGFVVGGGIAHMTTAPLRRRLARRQRIAETTL